MTAKRPLGLEITAKKIGMMREFTASGESIPVTVLQVPRNCVTQIKTEGNDGYCALQVTVQDTVPRKRLTKASKQKFAQANIRNGGHLREFRVSSEVATTHNLGDEITMQAAFQAVEFVDITGTSKGKGFSGAIKRHNFSSQRASHGNSLSHRAPGSIGQNQTPGRVYKGKKMAGQLGNKRCTVQNLKIVRIDVDRALLLIQGAVPGAPSGYVTVKPAIKVNKKDKEDGRAA